MNRLLEVEVALADQLAADDAAEDAGLLAPDDRRTCHTCRAWATDEHLTSPAHLRATFARPDYVAAFVAARRHAAGQPSRDSAESASRGEGVA
jgi:hypothetical protein